MKHLISFLFLFGYLSGFSQINFSDYFIDKTLRFDYIHAGTADTAQIYFEQFKKEQAWAGSKKKLTDPMTYGKYKLMVFDSASNTLIYSRGYNTLFEEWQTTDEAKITPRSFYETVLMPFPKKTIRIEILEEKRKTGYEKSFTTYLNPENYFIVETKLPEYPVKKLLESGNAANCVDIVILPEGYSAAEMEKFNKDCQRFVNTFFSYEPYKSNKSKFNFYAVEAPSAETGTDIPGEHIWKKTAMNSNFYTFNIDRYLTTSDIKSVRDIAASATYDQMFILVNTNKYGGGGIYNHYSMSMSDHLYFGPVLIHEFGHGFASLADEYWTSDVAYNNYYDMDKEPNYPNITSLKDFDKKWKNMVDKNIPIPTPNSNEYSGKVGAFEGGGYVEKGIYRPSLDCLMKSIQAREFCPVCKKAISDMINAICD